MSDVRKQALADWAAQALDAEIGTLDNVAGDASFRRYFRAWVNGRSWILMDAPPPQEDSARFTRLARAFSEIGVRVPVIRADDAQKGFVLLEDFGDELLGAHLTRESVDRLYAASLDELFLMQANGGTLADQVPPYDRALLEREVGIFSEWLVDKRLGLSLDSSSKTQMEDAFALLVDSALEQPGVLVHRDYHSRNLLVIDPSRATDRPGVIDFQDAVYGPITYDLVSLLRDCYIDWPEARVDAWAEAYFNRLTGVGMVNVALTRFMRWFDLMGMQRHIKAAGIFCRLHLRDGRDGYLSDIPRTLRYVVSVARRHDDLGDFGQWVERDILPHFEEAKV